MRFNPISGLFSLVVGWFLMAILQAAVRSVFAGDFAASVAVSWTSAFSAAPTVS